MMKISDLQAKDIVNMENGKRLGTITDLDIQLTTGKIGALVIGGTGRVMGLFGKDEEVVIPWKNIVKIGSDVILVEVPDTMQPRRASFHQNDDNNRH
ncbi:YlmC/YmxH family sporulation protein [Halalkalibacterium ligniniphilum]|uniref:YlmC/YmxH family sporulation protein n=1 Tax=Halalkalibacterium ligniniphilum TaxID=1134413 RepID=UPI0003475C07|nr:YlmC/YmxH family sporulation protein [Halalkalibacterium ligniniphilum]